MGKVVKGAQIAHEKYQIKPPPPSSAARSLPSYRPHAPAEADAFDASDEVQAPAEPQVDFEAIQAEAEKLIDDASADAQKLIRDAQERAVALLEDAQRRVTEIEAAAKQQGFDQGVGDGRNAAQAEMDEMLATMRGLVEMARVERHKIIETAEPEIVRLAVNIAERILTQHVAVDKNTVLEMVRAAITRLVNREKVTVRVNPSDIETMREHREQLMSMNDIDNMRIIEDQRVDRGGVVIETDAGTIDSKISTQLREVRRLLAVDDPIAVAPANEPAIFDQPAQAS